MTKVILIRICVDLDGVICNEPDMEPPKRYKHVEIYTEAIKFIRTLFELGYEVIIYSARFEEDRELTEKILDNNDIPYDNLILGKPYADVYIDDRAIEFDGWNDFDKYLEEIENVKDK